MEIADWMAEPDVSNSQVTSRNLKPRQPSLVEEAIPADSSTLERWAYCTETQAAGISLNSLRLRFQVCLTPQSWSPGSSSTPSACINKGPAVLPWLSLHDAPPAAPFNLPVPPVITLES